MLGFLKSRWYQNVRNVSETPESIYKAYYLKWNKKNTSESLYEQFKTTNVNKYESDIAITTKALELAKTLKLL